MPHNAVLDVLFSDTQSSSEGLGSASVFTYTAVGGEYSFQDDRLIGSTVLLLFRDGPDYEQIDLEADFDFVNKQFKLNNEAGTIIFPDNNPPVGKDPWPPLQYTEKVTILYITGDATIVLTEPVTYQQVKDHLKLETDYDQTIIETIYIPAARAMCEDYVGQSLVERTVTATLRNDLGGVRLPYGPVSNVVSITDENDNAVAITNTTFTGIKFLMLNYCNGTSGDFDYRRNSDMLCATEPCNIFTLIYTAGYSVCPAKFKDAILSQVAWLYQNRGDSLRSSQMATEAELILRKYKTRI